MRAAMIVHGGAGRVTYRKGDRRFEVLKAAVEDGLGAMRKGSALDGVEAAVVGLEGSGLFNSGRGACLTLDGEVQLDAAVMTGKGLRGAGVGAATCTYHPVSLARWVMEQTPHVLMVGGALEECAVAAGMKVEEVRPSKAALKKYATLTSGKVSGRSPRGGGTVGAVALGEDGVPAAAVSTGGIWLKRSGRVGDSAVLGAGLYADARSGAACATGTGEEIIRTALSLRACEFMEGSSAHKGALRAVRMITRERGAETAGLITVDIKGRVGAAYNTGGMGRAWWDPERGRPMAAV
ncbi:MAG: isoaspartyl peptidase/L-asparaginase [archaeon]|nr:MAG: isoaspartyl peptidase/L-asparaginase [archaeon]